MSYKVIECEGEEAQRILRMIEKGERHPGGMPGFTLKGYVDAVCRNDDGSVAWELHQPNLITNFGRRYASYGVYNNFMGLFYSMMIFTSPSTMQPSKRVSMLRDPYVSPYYGRASGSINPSYDGATATKTWLTTFGVPGSAINIGTIGLCSTAPNNQRGGYYSTGVIGICAYTLLPNVKTQSTSQTLEVQYKVTFSAHV